MIRQLQFKGEGGGVEEVYNQAVHIFPTLNISLNSGRHSDLYLEGSP